MTATWPDPDPGWRVRVGVSLVEYAPMSDERRAIIADETERERLADEAAAKLAEQAKVEADAERAFFGVEKRSVADVLAQHSIAADRQDRRDRAAEEKAARELGRPLPSRPSSAALLREAAQERKQREAADESTPATVAEIKRLKTKIAAMVGNAVGKWQPPL